MLIQITEQKGQQVVSARDLHSFLGSKKDFSNWIKHRITKYGLAENQDYIVFAQTGEKGGRPTNEYGLTLDAAKELAMVEGNAKGKEARQYFIEMEKKVKYPAVLSPKQLAQMVIDAENEKEKAMLQLNNAEQIIKQQAPAVKYAKEILTADGCILSTVIAKELGYSAVTLNRKLQELKVIRKVRDTYVLYEQYQNKGYAKTETFSYTDTEGNTKTKIQLVWTEKGRGLIHKILNPVFN
jgi:anti-repressor protein